jgi:hypothetical protein
VKIILETFQRQKEKPGTVLVLALLMGLPQQRGNQPNHQHSHQKIYKADMALKSETIKQQQRMTRSLKA